MFSFRLNGQIDVGKGVMDLLVEETVFSDIIPFHIGVLVSTEQTFSIPNTTHNYIRQSYRWTMLSSHNIPSPWKSRRKPAYTARVNHIAPLQAFPGLPVSPSVLPQLKGFTSQRLGLEGERSVKLL